MAQVFTSLLLLDHECSHKLTNDLEPRLRPSGRSKLSWSIIPADAQSVKRSVIGRPAQAKAIVISYNLWMSRKTEEIFLLTAHYCTGTNINNTHIGMPSTTATDGVSLYKYAM